MIDKELWDSLQEFLNNFPDLKCFNASDAEICEAESKLGLIFSDFFRYFLKYYSVKKIGNYSINNIHFENNLSHISNSPIVGVTKKFKIESSIKDKSLYIIASKDNELIVSNKVGKIFITNTNNKLIKIAEDFEEFLSKALSTVT